MKTLVTGATGFVGSNLVRKLLERGDEVRVTVREGSDTRNLDGLDVERVRADLRDAAAIEAAVRGCNRVFHAGAMVAFWVPPGEQRHFYEVNVTGTRNVLLAAGRRDVERVVYTSTISAIGTRPDGGLTCEDDSYTLWHSGTDYEHSKLAAEFEVWRFAALGLPVVAVLPTGPLGWRDRTPNPLGRIVLDFLARRLPATAGGGNLIDVDDVAEGHLLAAEKGRPGERYILGHENLSVVEILAALAEVSGVPALPVKLPTPVALGTAYLLKFVADRITRRHPLLTPSVVKIATSDYYVDTTRARQELGFEPRSSVRQAAARAIRWFLDNGYVKQSEAKRARIRERVEAVLPAST